MVSFLFVDKHFFFFVPSLSFFSVYLTIHLLFFNQQHICLFCSDALFSSKSVFVRSVHFLFFYFEYNRERKNEMIDSSEMKIETMKGFSSRLFCESKMTKKGSMTASSPSTSFDNANSPGRFVCSMCAKVYRSGAGLRYHKRKRHRGKFILSED